MSECNDVSCNEQLNSAIALSQIVGVGPRQATLLTEYAGSAEGVFQLTREQLVGIPGIGGRTVWSSAIFRIS